MGELIEFGPRKKKEQPKNNQSEAPSLEQLVERENLALYFTALRAVQVAHDALSEVRTESFFNKAIVARDIETLRSIYNDIFNLAGIDDQNQTNK
jgi:hypothetical protein